MGSLTEKKCKPCEGIGKALTKKEALEYLPKVPGWNINTEGTMIDRQIQTKNFVGAVDIINKVANIAENENHHPDIHLTGYRNLRIELSTHALKGLSENDFIVAAKINEIETSGAK